MDSIIKLLKDFASSLGKDGGTILFSRIIQMGNAFLVSIFLVKKFGLHAMGTFTVSSIAIMFLSLLCALGLNYSLPHEDLKHAERNTIALILTFMAFPLTVLVLYLYALIMAHRSGEVFEIVLFGLSGFFFAQANVLNTLLLLEKKIKYAVGPPLLTTVGIVSGIIFSDSVFMFAVFMISGRFIGNGFVFTRLEYAKVSFKTLRDKATHGLKYIPMDFFALLSDQTATIISANLLTRSELGVFGLCRQVLTACDTPGWSVMQGNYPRLVENKLAHARELVNKIQKLSFVIMGVMICGSAVLGFLIYKIEEFWYLCLLLAIILPVRYRNNFYDQVIRASGGIRTCTALAFTKLMVSVFLFPFMIINLKIWGAILGLVVLSLISVTIYYYKANPLLLKVPVKVTA